MRVQTIGVINLNTSDMSNTGIWRVWKVRFQEVGRKKIGETKHTGPHGREEVIKLFGLDGPDIMWYELEEVVS